MHQTWFRFWLRVRWRAYRLVQLTVCDEEEQKNRLPDEVVCDIQHTVHLDELVVIRQHKRNGQPDEGVCDIHHTVHSDELFVIRQQKETNNPIKVCAM